MQPSQILESPSAICRCGKMMWWFYILDVDPSEIVTNSRSFFGGCPGDLYRFIMVCSDIPRFIRPGRIKRGAHLSCNFFAVRFWVRFTVDASLLRKAKINTPSWTVPWLQHQVSDLEAEYYIYIYRRIYTNTTLIIQVYTTPRTR